jgi:hypothetical protein
MGLTLLDIVNIYWPPVLSSLHDCHQNTFNIEHILATISTVEDVSTTCNHCAILFAGDINAHSKVWDFHTREDKLGKDIATTLLDFGFAPANDGEATYVTHQSRTAPDITFYQGDFSIENWSHAEPFGKCHHYIISYDLVMSFASLCHLDTTETDTFYKTHIAWKNVNHDQYNTTLENAVFLIFACHPLPTIAEAQIYFLSGVLTHSFQLANKSLPQGHCTSPTIHCPHHLEKLLNEHNAAWHQAVSHNTEQDWETFTTKAESFCHETCKVQTEYWCSYCNDLSYSTDATQVTKTLDSLTDTTFPETSTNIL